MKAKQIFTYTIKPLELSPTRFEKENHLIRKPLNLKDENGVITFSVGGTNNVFTCYPGTYKIRDDGAITLYLGPDHWDLEDDHSRASGYLDSVNVVQGAVEPTGLKGE